MTFNPDAGGQITLAQGAELTAKYRRLNPDGIKARYFGKDCFTTLLNQTEKTAVGIRIYFGVNAAGDQELVMVGVDSNGDDILGIVMDISMACPTTCSTPNALNS